MKIDTWMPFYVGDYLGDTMDLSTEQHGAYVLLMLAYWRNRGPLPDDDDQFCRITRLMRDAWRTHRPRIAMFFQIQSGYWNHKRIDLELIRAERNSQARVSAATKAASARWRVKIPDETIGKNPIPDALLDGCVTHTPSPSPSDLKNPSLAAGAGEGGKTSGGSPQPGGMPASNHSGEMPPPSDSERLSKIPNGEIPSIESVKAAVMTTGIPDGFVELVYDTWQTRSGRDGAGIAVGIIAYVKNRWKKEQTEWRSGTHRAQKGENGKTSRSSRGGGSDRNAGTLNNPNRYRPENLPKRGAYVSPNEVPPAK